MDATGKTVATIGDGAVVAADSGQLFVSLKSATGRLTARAELDTHDARNETQTFRRAGHRLDGHRIATYTEGVRLAKIVLEECT